MPYAEELTLPQGMQATSTVSKVEINVPVDAAIFDMPKNNTYFTYRVKKQ